METKLNRLCFVSGYGDDFYCQLTPANEILCGGFSKDLLHIPPPGEYKDLGCNERFMCALDSGGELYCWGGYYETRNVAQNYPELDYSILMNAPAVVREYRAIKVGSDSVCAISVDDYVVCWDYSQPYDEIYTPGIVDLEYHNDTFIWLDEAGFKHAFDDEVQSNTRFNSSFEAFDNGELPDCRVEDCKVECKGAFWI